MRISDWSSDVCSSDLSTACPPPNGKRGFTSPRPPNSSRGWKKAWPRIPDPARASPRRFSPTHHPHPAEHNMSEATTADEKLRLLLERIERLEDEKKGIRDDRVEERRVGKEGVRQGGHRRSP